MASDPAAVFRQLLPAPARVDADGLLGRLDLAPLAPAERPYTLVNFVATADGRATFRGRSGPLGDEGDRAMFHGLREQVDAVLAGTGTLRAERYGRILRRPERRERRLARGLSPEPLTCIVTRSGDLPTDIPLLECPEARVIVFAPLEPPGLRGAGADVQLHVVEPELLTLTRMMEILRSQHEVRSLLCEGGPTLFGALLAEGLVDELFLTVVPKLAGGGEELGVTAGAAPAELTDLTVKWLLERDGSLFLRYGTAGGGAPGRGAAS